MRQLARKLQALIAPVVVLALWEAAADAGLLPDYLVAPSKIAAVFTRIDRKSTRLNSSH